MTKHLQFVIDKADSKARQLRLEANRAEEIVKRMRALAVHDEWHDHQEAEWSELEKQLKMCGDVR